MYLANRLCLMATVYVGLGACSSPKTIVQVDPPPDTTTTILPPGNVTVTVDYATFLGGVAYEEAREPVVLADGRLLFGLRTYSSNMPATAGAIQSSFRGGEGDTFIALLSPDGSSLLAGSYLGGSGQERTPYGMEVASNGDIVIASGSDSPDFFTTPGAYRSQVLSGGSDGYVCRLSPDLTTRRWCSYVGADPRGGLALTAGDEPILVGGATASSQVFPTAGAYQTSLRGADDAFVLKLNSSGSASVWSTFLGGFGGDQGEVALSVNLAGSDLIVGGISQSSDFPTTPGAHQSVAAGRRDGFIAKLSDDGTQLRYSSLVGGSGEDEAKHRNHVQVDGSVILGGVWGSPNVAGATGSLQGAMSGWVGKLNTSGSFDFLRYLGGSGNDLVVDRAADAAGRIYAVGATTSDDFPVTAGALQTKRSGGDDGFLVILDQSGNVLYGTYLGGVGYDGVRGVEVGPDGDVYIVGGTESSNFPVTTGVFQSNRSGERDGFAMRLSISP